MSGLLQGKVWQSALPARLKPLAAALADSADDDGSHVYPSVAYLAWKLSDDDVSAPRKNERTIQRGVTELRDMGVLVFADENQAVLRVVGGRQVWVPKGGRRHDGGAHTTEYRFVESALPRRRPWSERYVKGANLTGLDSAPKDAGAEIVTVNGDTGAGVKGDTHVTQHVRSTRPSHPSFEPEETYLSPCTQEVDPDRSNTQLTAAKVSNSAAVISYWCSACNRERDFASFDKRTGVAFCSLCDKPVVKRQPVPP